MSADNYRRGRRAQRNQKRPKVNGFFRPLLPVIWGIGAVLFVVAIGIQIQAALAVILVTHLFFVGLVWVDMKSLRRQGLDFGNWRFAWALAALVLPFAALAYWFYAGRRIGAENRSRGYVDGEFVGLDAIEGDAPQPEDTTVEDIHEPDDGTEPTDVEGDVSGGGTDADPDGSDDADADHEDDGHRT